MRDPTRDWANQVAPLALALAAVICLMAALAGCGDVHLHFHAASVPQTVLELPELPDPGADTAPATAENGPLDGPEFVLELPE